MTEPNPEIESAPRPSLVVSLQTELAEQRRACALLEEQLEVSLLSGQVPMECSDETGACVAEKPDDEETVSQVSRECFGPGGRIRSEDACTQCDRPLLAVNDVAHASTQSSVTVPATSVPPGAEPRERFCLSASTQTAAAETGPRPAQLTIKSSACLLGCLRLLFSRKCKKVKSCACLVGCLLLLFLSEIV